MGQAELPTQSSLCQSEEGSRESPARRSVGAGSPYPYSARFTSSLAATAKSYQDSAWGSMRCKCSCSMTPRTAGCFLLNPLPHHESNAWHTPTVVARNLKRELDLCSSSHAHLLAGRQGGARIDLDGQRKRHFWLCSA